eukprot:2165088-Pleurochrysis_carterae.AAC.1
MSATCASCRNVQRFGSALASPPVRTRPDAACTVAARRVRLPPDCARPSASTAPQKREQLNAERMHVDKVPQ